MHCKNCHNEPVTLSAKKGFTGVHCQMPYETCPVPTDGTGKQKFCFNGGTCERARFNNDEYHCACPQDPREKVYAGLNCIVEATDFCQEDGFFDITGGKWFCAHGGTCINGETNLAKKCTCPEGKFGLHCEFLTDEECNLDCNNGGKCKIGLKDFSHMAEYGLDIVEYLGGQEQYGEHCVCPQGFSGAKCQVEDIVRCGQGICFNGAECVQTVSLDGTEVYNEYCRCKAEEVDGNHGGNGQIEIGNGIGEIHVQYAGKFCEHVATTSCKTPYGHNPDEYFCTNGGECPDLPHLPCKCVDGYTGPKCEIAPDADLTDECDLDCLNEGQCFFGQSPVVDEELQKLHTSGLDFLLENKHCRCPEGFIGLKCEMRFEKCGDDEHYCLHGAGCVSDGDQYTCDCKDAATLLDSYAGEYCEHAATQFCQGPGANSESFCANHGTCLGDIGVGEDHVGCRCEEGWTGEYCEFDKLVSTNVAKNVFAEFAITITAIIVTFGAIAFFVRKRQGRDIEYEEANAEPPTLNPYGEIDSDLSDGGSEEEDYELTDVAII